MQLLLRWEDLVPRHVTHRVNYIHVSSGTHSQDRESAGGGQERGLGSESWIQMQALQPAGWLTLSKLFNVSKVGNCGP